MTALENQLRSFQSTRIPRSHRFFPQSQRYARNSASPAGHSTRHPADPAGRAAAYEPTAGVSIFLRHGMVVIISSISV